MARVLNDSIYLIKRSHFLLSKTVCVYWDECTLKFLCIRLIIIQLNHRARFLFVIKRVWSVYSLKCIADAGLSPQVLSDFKLLLFTIVIFVLQSLVKHFKSNKKIYCVFCTVQAIIPKLTFDFYWCNFHSIPKCYCEIIAPKI